MTLRINVVWYYILDELFVWQLFFRTKIIIKKLPRSLEDGRNSLRAIIVEENQGNFVTIGEEILFVLIMSLSSSLVGEIVLARQ